jgi:hypothetical protein
MFLIENCVLPPGCVLPRKRAAYFGFYGIALQDEGHVLIDIVVRVNGGQMGTRQF